jgi:hypothetical protein
MKKHSNTLFAQISQEEMNNLAAMINETLATGLVQSSKKQFTVAELWNIQRRANPAMNRRKY